jgi:hypothetical protein
MKALIIIAIIVVVGFGVSKLYDYYQNVNQENDAKRQEAAAANVAPEQLPGLPYQLEPPFRKAQEEGVKGLKQWLETNRRNPQLKDPRLAWIELDYVLLIKGTDPVEAKRVFADVKNRTPPDSPVSPRIKIIEKTFE